MMKYLKEYKDYVNGGKADKLFTIEDIAKEYIKNNHDMNYDEILDVLKRNYKIGIKVETEHTSDKNIAHEITRDHLSENPRYYEILYKAGLVD